MMTFRELKARLQRAGIENAEWDAALLTERFAHIPASVAPLEPDRELPTDEAFESAVARRAAREPLQYILGKWEFYRQTYEVTPDCLVPRSDTEILVERAVKLLPEHAHFADYCTGSGCIAISILAERKDTVATAVELFPKTLELATRNAKFNQVSSRFTPILGDVMQKIDFPEGTKFDAILSNPPYIPADVIPALAPEVKREPLAALDGGIDGLDFYRAILRYGKERLKEDGFFLFEIGFDQKEALRTLGEEAGFKNFTCLKDYGGQDRVVELRRK